MMYNIGFMQGRLSPIIEGKIQCFPWKYWEKEFEIAKRIKINLMEWTLDQKELHNNPLMTEKGRAIIKNLIKENDVNIQSLTGDCFMQKPFWKENGVEKNNLINDFFSIVSACGELKIKIIVIPLVDDGSIDNVNQEKELLNFFKNFEKFLKKNNVKIAFESDYNPKKLKHFINELNQETYGINYDTGNSASYGYDISEEFFFYGKRILNIHIKDRPYKGNTVPLGEGDVDFDNFFQLLKKYNYKGNLILQTARSKDNHHVELISEYKSRIENYLTY